MNKNILYVLIFTILFFALIVPDAINPSKGLIFTLEEWIALILLLLAVVFFRNSVSKVIDRLNVLYPWQSAFKKRIIVQVLILALGTAIVSAVILLPMTYYIKKNGIPEFYQEVIDKKNEIKAITHERWNENDTDTEWEILELIANVADDVFLGILLIFTVEETYRYLSFRSRKKLELETLLKEQAQLKASVLKKQLDPHFMFNTLNVLAGLIYQDVDRSAQFIKELSKVYRYVLEQSEELVSTVEQEFQFLDSYMYLLKIRFDNKIPVSIDIPQNRKDWLLPSMTLELLVENAIKHNVVDREQPLYLDFSIQNDQLMVKNNLQPRNTLESSLGLGLSNLKKRLDLLNKSDYSFTTIGDQFVATVPLINPKDV